MSLLEAESARHKKRRRKKKPPPPLSVSHPDQVLTFTEWCRINRISESTGRRILKGDNGPTVTQLGDWRSGITVGNNALWQQSRERASNDTKPRRRGQQQSRRAPPP